MKKLIECYCHDPLNKTGVHYHIVEETKSCDSQRKSGSGTADYPCYSRSCTWEMAGLKDLVGGILSAVYWKLGAASTDKEKEKSE